MSEIDDLMVDLLMRSDSEAELAAVQLIRFAEAGELTAKEKTLILKAIDRRIEDARRGTDIYDFLMRLSSLIQPATDEETNHEQ